MGLRRCNVLDLLRGALTTKGGISLGKAPEPPDHLEVAPIMFRVATGLHGVPLVDDKTFGMELRHLEKLELLFAKLGDCQP